MKDDHLLVVSLRVEMEMIEIDTVSQGEHVEF
jgi:hypothetical protein